MGSRIVRNQNRIRLSSDKLKAALLRADKLGYKEIGIRLGVTEYSAFNKVQSFFEIVRAAMEDEMRQCK